MLSKENVAVSFVIPTLNESTNIASTIASIKEFLFDVSHEVIVVDNGSSDNTIGISKGLADKVLANDVANIGALRNIGAEASSGDILIFNDADVSITREWRDEFDKLFSQINSKRLIVGGSLETLENESLLFYSWFKPLLKKKASSTVKYVGTGHMVLSRKVFFECGEFDSSLVTGEDSEFCRRASKNNVKVSFNQNLKVIHRGYPVTLKAFFKREFWHGSGDYQSLTSFLSSKLAIFACGMLFLHALLILTLMLQQFQYAILMIFSCISFPIVYSLARFPDSLGLKIRLLNFLYAYSYLLARSLSWTQRLSP